VDKTLQEQQTQAAVESAASGSSEQEEFKVRVSLNHIAYERFI